MTLVTYTGPVSETKTLAPAGHFNIADRHMPTGWYQTTNQEVAETAARAGQYVTFTNAAGETTEFVVEEVRHAAGTRGEEN